MILASVLLFAGCVKEEMTGSFDNIKLDKTMLVIPEKGGSVELTINATESWAFDTLYTEDVWPNVITRKKNDAGEYYVSKVEASWLSVDKMAGEAGETKLKFTADEVAGGREIELCIKAGINSQFIKVRQGSLEASSATCAEVIAGPDGKTYRIKGVVTSIANTTYGNWYLNDGTGEVYIYGTLDKDGKTKNFSSLGIEVGDVVECEGPKTTYGTTVELVDVTVLKIEKSLMKIVTEEKTYEKEGGEFDIKIAFKGEGLYPTVDSLSRSWVSVVSVNTYAGTPTKIEPSPADTAIVTFALAPFEEKASPRKGAIHFTTSSGKSSTDMTYTITQKGAIPDPIAIKDATKVDEGVCVEGTVVAICSQGYLLADETGVILIYHPETGWENTFVIGDKVKVAADALGAYNFSAQLKTPYFEEKTSEKPVEVTYPAPVNYDAAKVAAVIDALKTAVDPANKEKEVALKVEYINMTGKLKIDGKYHNVEIAGSEYMGSLYNPIEDLKLADFNGKVVTLGGYFLSVSQSSGAFKYINMVVTSVAEAGDVKFPSFAFAKNSDKVADDVTEYSLAFTSTDCNWTLTASEGVTLDKTTGTGDATVKMTFAANTTDADIVYTVTAKAEGVADKTFTLTHSKPIVAKVIYSETFAEGMGGFTVEGNKVADDKDVWFRSEYNGDAYLKASAYISNVRYASESICVSPIVDLTSETGAYISFEHTGKYFGDMTTEATFCVREENGTWATIAIPTYMTGSDWVFVNSGEIDLSAYVGKKIQFGFKYTSTDTTAATWEVKNIVILDMPSK